MWVIPYTAPRFTTAYQVFSGNPLYVLVFALLSTCIQFGIGHIFYLSAYKSVRHWNFNMDVLIVLGTTAAWMYGIMLIVMGYNFKNG